MSEIPYFTLNNGVKMPAVLMGCWQGSPNEVAHGLSDAIAAGYRGLDTAKMYANEASVGKAVRDSGLPREEFFVTTKLSPNHSDREDVAGAFQRSLDALDIGYIDLYLMHWPQGHKDGKAYNGPPDGSSFNDVWAEMEKLLDTGKVRAIGVSNFSPKTFPELLKTAKVVPAVNQVEGHPYLPDPELIKFTEEKGIHTSYYTPLALGSHLLQEPAIEAAAKAHGCTPGQVVLSWSVQKGRSVNPRSTNPKRMKDNLSLIKLSDKERKEIDAISSEPGKQVRMNVAAYRYETKTLMVERGWTLEDLGWNIGFPPEEKK